MTAATAEKIDPVVLTARRFGLPELNDSALWLVPRLSRAYPHLQKISLMGWLRGVMDVEEYHFVCTDHAVSLSQRVNEKLYAGPIVREHFTLPKSPEYLDEAAFLYTEIRQWAFRLGAFEVHLQQYYDEKEYPEEALRRMTDCPRDMVKPAFGRLFLREILFARIGAK